MTSTPPKLAKFDFSQRRPATVQLNSRPQTALRHSRGVAPPLGLASYGLLKVFLFVMAVSNVSYYFSLLPSAWLVASLSCIVGVLIAMPFVSPSTSMFASSRSHILSTPRTLTTSQQASLGATSSPNRNYDSLATNVARQPIATHATKLRCWVTPNDHCHKVVANDNQGFFFHGLAMLFGLATFLVIIASTFWRKQFGHRDEVALTPLVGEKGVTLP